MGLWGALSGLWSRARSLFGAKSAARGHDPRRYLAGAAPGWWSSNHLNETARNEGWQFVAVRTVARMASQAAAAVTEVGSRGEKIRRVRRALRWARLTAHAKAERYWRKRLGKLLRLKSKKARKSAGHRKGTQPPDAPRPVRDGHPLARLMRRVNPGWSLSTFLFAAAQQICLTGSCLVWCVRHGGETAELYVLPTGLCQVRGPSAEFPLGSYYLTPLSAWGLTPPDGDWATGTLGGALITGCEIDYRDVKAVRWPHPLYLSDGLSPLSAVRLWVDVSNEMDRATFAAMLNTQRPGLVITHRAGEPMPDGPDKVRFEEYLRSESAGSSNTGRHMWLPPGLDADVRTGGPAEVDFPEGRRQYRDMSLAAHGVSQIAAGIMEAGSRAGYVASIRQTTDLAVQPLLSLLAGELTELLGGEFDGPRCEVAFEAPGIDDPAELEQRLRTDVQAGNAITVDEYRAVRKLPPLGGELGKAFVGQRTSVRMVDADGNTPGVQTPEETGAGTTGGGRGGN